VISEAKDHRQQSQSLQAGAARVMKRDRVGRIMVVDDQPANLKLMEEILRQEGYTVRSFPRGRLALAVAGEDQPDLILLDITMPEMDGFEVCEHLKSDPKLAPIPVIFLSALSDTNDKVKAFRCGGVDYITKPISIPILRARMAALFDQMAVISALDARKSAAELRLLERTRSMLGSAGDGKSADGRP